MANIRGLYGEFCNVRNMSVLKCNTSVYLPLDCLSYVFIRSAPAPNPALMTAKSPKRHRDSQTGKWAVLLHFSTLHSSPYIPLISSPLTLATCVGTWQLRWSSDINPVPFKTCHLLVVYYKDFLDSQEVGLSARFPNMTKTTHSDSAVVTLFFTNNYPKYKPSYLHQAVRDINVDGVITESFIDLREKTNDHFIQWLGRQARESRLSYSSDDLVALETSPILDVSMDLRQAILKITIWTRFIRKQISALVQTAI